MNNKKLFSKIVAGLMIVSVGATTLANPLEGVNEIEDTMIQVVDELEAESTQEQTAEINSNQVVISNNVYGTDDTIVVNDLVPGTIVKMYTSAVLATPVDIKTVPKDSTSVTFTFKQLGVEAGKIYISVTEAGKTESKRVTISYEGEIKAEALTLSQVEVINNANEKDLVKVNALEPGDVIKVYSEDGKKLLGQATVKADADGVIVTIDQIGKEATSILVSVTKAGVSESKKLEIQVPAEKVSDKLTLEQIAVVNNAGANDIVTVTGLEIEDIIRVYNATGEKLLGTAKAVAEDKEVAKTEEVVETKEAKAVVTITQIGTEETKIQISRTKKNELESEKLEVIVAAEKQTKAVEVDKIEIKNNVTGTKDTITVKGLAAGMVVNVYDTEDGTRVIGTATAVSGKDIVVSVTQLGVKAGKVYIAVKAPNELESTRVAVYFAAEEVTDKLLANQITVVNNAGAKDIVTVTGLVQGDVVKVYDETGTKVLGTATVSTGKEEAVVLIAQLGTEGGKIKVSVKNKTKLESEKIEVEVKAEVGTAALKEEQIKVTNNAVIKDTVEVKGLQEGDVIKAYTEEDGKLLGKATVAAGKTIATISIVQLGEAGGSVVITNTNKNALESSPIKVTYEAEPRTTAVTANNVIVVNNLGTDVIFIYGLKPGTVVSVYDAAKEGKVIAKSTVAAKQTQVYMTVTQVGAEGGTLYISLTETGCLESDRVAVMFDKE